MTAKPARYRHQTISHNGLYTVRVHRTPADPLADARLQRAVDDCIESFRLAAHLTDGSRSALVRAATAVLAAAAGRAERSAA